MDLYAPLAPAYGTMTADWDYDRWLAVIELHAQEAGMSGSRVLDVACGSGSSFLPLLDRYEMTACDLSAAMLEEARQRLGGRSARLLQHDMRTLPVLGEFDLVLCLDDALNHLLDPAELRGALAGIAANLAPGGVAVFDVNTLATLRTLYSSDAIVESERRDELVVWRGQGRSDLEPRGLTSARVEVLAADEDGEGLYARSVATLVQRHHPIEDVVAAVGAVGLRLVRCLGQSTGVRISPDADDLAHNKALFVARRA
jgi:SAM-dependent methyltransferase